MDIDLIMLVYGLLLSAFFSLAPKVDVWFAALSDEVKRWIMIGLLCLAVLLIWGAGCIGLWGVCMDWRDVLRGLIMALVANQATFMITPKSQRVKDANTAGWIMRNESDMDYSEEDDVA